MKLHSLVFWALLLLIGGRVHAGDLRPVDLRCEYLPNPIGVDTPCPRLSWKLAAASEERGLEQSAYRVMVATTPEKLQSGRADLWDSGRVESDRQLHVKYSGQELGPRTRCHWKVRVWDQDGDPSGWSKPAQWSTGLFDRSDWQAEWITDPDPGPLQAGPHNGYHTEIAHSADEEKWVMVDLGEVRRIDAVRLWPARPYNWQPDTPGFLFPLRFRIEVAQGNDFSDAKVVVDRTEENVANPGMEPQKYSFEPVRARYVRLTATRLRRRDKDNYGMALAEMQVLSDGQNLARGADVTALDSVQSSGWSRARLVDGRLKPDPAGIEPRPATMLRKGFQVDGRVKRATLYVTGLGLYEVHVNGQRVGDALLSPEFTKYEKRVQYRALDVTDLMKGGENAVGAVLGDGWHANRFFGLPPVQERKFQGQRGLLVRLDLRMADGSEKAVVTDGSWRSTTDGPIRSGSLYDGEVYDARREKPGWDEAGYDDSDWRPVRTVEFPGTELAWQPNRPIRVTHEIEPLELTEPEDGVYVFDLGQNMVGWCGMKLRAPGGTRVTIQHGERLKDDGTLYTENLRSAQQRDVYICRGDGEEVFEPHFTYHGFRYVEVRGLPEPPRRSDLTGRVFHSAAPVAGRFRCSNELINRLMRNVLWTQRGNMHSVPTDCPQRDERAGWMGDIQAFSQTAIFNMDMAPFFTKWLADVCDSQHGDGCYPPFAPAAHQRGAPAWADGGVIIPWRMYVNYADRPLLERHFESARRWVDFVHEHNPDLIWRNRRGGDYGDWLNADRLKLDNWLESDGAVPKVVLATAFFAHSADLVGRMAKVLDRPEAARNYGNLAEKIKAAFNREFVDENGKIKGNTQAGYALALRFDLLPERLRPNAVEHIMAELKRYDGHLSTGIQTTHRLMLELTENGRHDEACRLIKLRTVPSWGYMIEQGATTIWERWDGYVEGRGLQTPGMNSFNHWAFGSVGEWVWRNIVGLNPDPAHPGYRHFIVRPRPCEGLTWARGKYKSVRGPIEIQWRIRDGQISLKVTVPPNAAATVHVPTSAPAQVREGGRKATESPHVNPIEPAVFRVGSGTYSFTAPAPCTRGFVTHSANNAR